MPLASSITTLDNVRLYVRSVLIAEGDSSTANRFNQSITDSNFSGAARSTAQTVENEVWGDYDPSWDPDWGQVLDEFLAGLRLDVGEQNLIDMFNDTTPDRQTVRALYKDLVRAGEMSLLRARQR